LADQVVNDPNTAALAAPTSHPPDLTQTSRLWNEVASFWIGDGHGLFCFIILCSDSGLERSLSYHSQFYKSAYARRLFFATNIQKKRA